MWYLYIIKCVDGSLYTGITIDVARRLDEHSGVSLNKGAKYTRGKGPFDLVYKAEFESKSLAAKEEYRIKKLSKTEKEKLISLQF
jgi:putative endonuclease